MLDIILIVLLIISISKPDILLSKNMKEKASEEQKNILAKNFRKIYAVLIGLLESAALTRYIPTVGIICVIVCFILFFTISLPAIKENSKIKKEVDAKQDIK